MHLLYGLTLRNHDHHYINNPLCIGSYVNHIDPKFNLQCCNPLLCFLAVLQWRSPPLPSLFSLTAIPNRKGPPTAIRRALNALCPPLSCPWLARRRSQQMRSTASWNRGTRSCGKVKPQTTAHNPLFNLFVVHTTTSLLCLHWPFTQLMAWKSIFCLFKYKYIY